MIHGILETDAEKGSIRIIGRKEDDRFTLSIIDNVVLEDLRTSTIDDDTHGYGMKNISRRMQLIFGNTYGLDFGHNEPSGTIVTINLPWKQE